MNFAVYTNPYTPVHLVNAGDCLRGVPNPEYVQRENEILDQFKQDAFRELGLSEHPKRDEIWEFAVIQGDYRTRGIRWVYLYLQKVASFLVG